MDDSFGPGLLVGILIGLGAGVFIAILSLATFEDEAAATDCAYYDPVTAEFTWGKLDGR